MFDITSHGVNFAVLQGPLLAGEISRSAFLERASPLGIGVSKAAAAADKFPAISANQAERQKESQI
jgi:choline dehydrogenase